MAAGPSIDRMGQPQDPADLRQAYRTLILLSLVYLLNLYDRLLVAVVSQPLREEFHLTDTQYGLLTGPAFVVLYAVGNLVFGWLADRYSRKIVLPIALAIWSGMTALSGLASSFVLLAIGRAGMGIGEGGSNPSGLSLLADYFPPKKRATAVSIFTAGGMLGLFLSFVLGSWIATHFGWRAVFLVAGVPGLILALVILLAVQEPPRGRFDADAPQKISYARTLSVLSRNAAFIWICLGAAGGTFNSLGMLIWLPQFFIRDHGLSLQQVGLFFGPAAALGLTAGVLVGGRIGDRLARRSLATPLLFCVGVNLVCIPMYLVVLWTGSLPLALTCTFLAMTTTSLYSPICQAAMQNVTAPEVRATAAGVFSLVVALIGQGMMPYAVGVLSDHLKPSVGDESLRWSLTILASAYSVLAAALFAKSYRSTRAHFARA